MITKELIISLIDEKLKDEELFLVDLEILPGNIINIELDGMEGVTIKDCVDFSRQIEHNLDREEEDFSLEVMSAGVSAPLEIPRQYKKNVGRKIKVKTDLGDSVEGELIEANDQGIKISWKEREPKPVGKGKITVQKEVELPYTSIKEAKVMITFN